MKKALLAIFFIFITTVAASPNLGGGCTVDFSMFNKDANATTIKDDKQDCDEGKETISLDNSPKNSTNQKQEAVKIPTH